MTPEELFQNNIRLSTYFANRYQDGILAYYREEILGEARIGLWKAATRFNPDKGFAFTTFAVTCIKSEILHFISNFARKINREFSIDIQIFDDLTIADTIPSNDLDVFDKVSINCINKYPLLKQNYVQGYSQTEIAKSMGLSRGHVSKLIKAERQQFKRAM